MSCPADSARSTAESGISRDIIPGCRKTPVRDVVNQNTSPATECVRGPLTCGNVVGGPLSYTWWGYRKRPCFGDHQALGPQGCDLRKRVNRIGRVRGLWGMRTQVAVHTTVLAGLPAR